jgi:very-short-patch-repair endonuclease
MKTRLSDALKQPSRLLRKRSTDAERKLWRHIRNGQVEGLKFRRQEPIEPYIVDFVCFEKHIIIELDGGHHGEDNQMQKDSQRSEYLQGKGFRVIRFLNNEVINNLDGVLKHIQEVSTSC